jgi:hypothetical protein
MGVRRPAPINRQATSPKLFDQMPRQSAAGKMYLATSHVTLAWGAVAWYEQGELDSHPNRSGSKDLHPPC